MVNEIQLKDRVEEDLTKVREIITNTNVGRTSLHDVILDKLSGDLGRNTLEQVELLKNYEIALSVFREASYTLREKMDTHTMQRRVDTHASTIQKPDTQTKFSLEETLNDALFFSNRYALHLAGEVGLTLLKSDAVDTETLADFGNEGNVSNDKDELTEMLVGRTLKDLQEFIQERKQNGDEVDDGVLRSTLETIFTTWRNQFNWDAYPGVTERFHLDDLVLKYDNYSMKGGEFKAKNSSVVVDDRFKDHRKEDVIGNKEFMDVLWKSLIGLSFYDPEARKNFANPPGKIMTYGDPGCGKTFGVEGAIQSYADFCRENGIAFWALTHSVSDYASHYQNLTANNLAELAKEINDFPGVVAMYVADCDLIFGSRADGLRPEEQKTQSVYMKMFDGTLVKKDGKTLFIFDANYMDGMDSALLDRIMDEIQHVKRFDNAEDFGALAKMSLTRGLEDQILANDEWTEVGQYLLDSGLSHRRMDAVFKKIVRLDNPPVDLIGSSYSDGMDYVRDQLREKLTYDNIVGTFRDYIQTQEDMSMATEQNRVRERTEKLMRQFGTNLEREKDPSAQA